MKSTFILSALTAIAAAGSTAEWKQRSVYQVLTDRFAKSTSGGSACSSLSNYCGGTFNGLKDQLSYIKGMGFDAIWISPVVENSTGGYHGYWAKNWDTINGYFGTADELKNLVSTAHSQGIWIMVDVVANHVAPIGSDFGQIYPYNQSSHYHSNC